MKIIPKFNYRLIAKWRAVDLRTTMWIAHACTSGVDFRACTKSGIIESIAKPLGFTSDAVKFVALMDAVAGFLPTMKSEFDKALRDRINEHAKRLDSRKDGELATILPEL